MNQNLTQQLKDLLAASSKKESISFGSDRYHSNTYSDIKLEPKITKNVGKIPTKSNILKKIYLSEAHRPNNENAFECDIQKTEKSIESAFDLIYENEFEKNSKLQQIQKKMDFKNSNVFNNTLIEKKEAKFMDEDNLNNDDMHDKRCQVCFSSAGQSFTIEPLKKYFEILTCSKCNIRAHLICLGINTKNDSIYFTCQTCSYQAEKNHLQCFVCEGNSGYLSRTRDGKWIHLLCSIGNQNIQIEGYGKLEIELKNFKKNKQKISSIRNCEICKIKTETFVCSENTLKSVHLRCALKCQSYGLNVSFKMRKNENFSPLCYLDEEEVDLCLEDILLNLKEIAGEFNFKIDDRIKNLTKKKRCEDSRMRKSFKENPESKSLMIFLKEKVNQKLSLFSQSTEKYEEEKSKRLGGSIIVTIKPNPIPPREIDPNYLRNFMRELTDDNYLTELEPDTQQKCYKGRVQSIPEMDNLSFPELLFFLNIFERRAKSAFNHLVELKDLDGLINSTMLFPSSISGILKLINEKYFVANCLDYLIEPILAELYNSKEKLAEVATIKLLSLYLNSPCGVMTNFTNLLLKNREPRSLALKIPPEIDAREGNKQLISLLKKSEQRDLNSFLQNSSQKINNMKAPMSLRESDLFTSPEFLKVPDRDMKKIIVSRFDDSDSTFKNIKNFESKSIFNIHVKKEEVPEKKQNFELQSYQAFKDKLARIIQRLVDPSNLDGIKLEDGKSIIDEAEKFELNNIDGRNLKILQERISKASSLKEKILKYTKLNQLENLEIELRENKIAIPESLLLRKKVELTRKIEDLNDNIKDLKYLEDQLDEFQSNQNLIDPILLLTLQSKVKEGQNIRKKALGILEKKFVNTDDIMLISSCCNKSKELKIKFDEIQNLKKRFDEFMLITRIYSIFFNVMDPDRESVESGDYFDLIKLGSNEIAEKCLNTLDGSLSQDQIYSINEQVSKFLRQYNIKINSSYLQLVTNICKRFYNPELSSYNKQIKDTHHRKEDVFLSEDSIDESIQEEDNQISPLRKKIQNISTSNMEVLLSNMFGREYRQKNDIKKGILDLEEMKKRVEYETTFKSNKSLIQNQIKWLHQVLQIIYEIEFENKKIEFDLLESLFEDSKNYNILSSYFVMKKVSKWYQESAHARENFSDFLTKTVHKSDQHFEFCSISKIMNLIKARPEISEMKLVWDSLEKVNYINLSQEINHLRSLAEKADEWASFSEITIHSYINCFKILGPNEKKNALQISQEVDAKFMKIKIDLQNLSVKIELTMEQLKSFEWIFNAYKCLNGLNSEYSYKEWKKIYLESLDLKSINQVFNIFADEINKEITNAKYIRKYIKKLQDVKYVSNPKSSYLELLNIIEKTQMSRIQMEEEKKVLNFYFESSKRIKEYLRDLTNNSELDAVKIELIRKEIIENPIDLSEELKLLEHFNEMSQKSSDDNPRLQIKAFDSKKDIFSEVNCFIKGLSEKIEDQDILKNLENKKPEDLESGIKSLELNFSHLTAIFKNAIFLNRCSSLKITEAKNYDHSFINSMVEEGNRLLKIFPNDENIANNLELLDIISVNAIKSSQNESTILNENIPKSENLKVSKRGRPRKSEKNIEEKKHNFDVEAEPKKNKNQNSKKSKKDKSEKIELVQTSVEYATIYFKNILIEILDIEESEAIDYSQKMVEAIPNVTDTRSFEKIKEKVRMLLSYSYINRKLIKEKFEPSLFEKYIKKAEQDFEKLNKKLKKKFKKAEQTEPESPYKIKRITQEDPSKIAQNSQQSGPEELMEHEATLHQLLSGKKKTNNSESKEKNDFHLDPNHDSEIRINMQEEHPTSTNRKSSDISDHQFRHEKSFNGTDDRAFSKTIFKSGFEIDEKIVNEKRKLLFGEVEREILETETSKKIKINGEMQPDKSIQEESCIMNTESKILESNHLIIENADQLENHEANLLSKYEELYLKFSVSKSNNTSFLSNNPNYSQKDDKDLSSFSIRSNLISSNNQQNFADKIEESLIMAQKPEEENIDLNLNLVLKDGQYNSEGKMLQLHVEVENNKISFESEQTCERNQETFESHISNNKNLLISSENMGLGLAQINEEKMNSQKPEQPVSRLDKEMNSEKINKVQTIDSILTFELDEHKIGKDDIKQAELLLSNSKIDKIFPVDEHQQVLYQENDSNYHKYNLEDPVDSSSQELIKNYAEVQSKNYFANHTKNDTENHIESAKTHLNNHMNDNIVENYEYNDEKMIKNQDEFDECQINNNNEKKAENYIESQLKEISEYKIQNDEQKLDDKLECIKDEILKNNDNKMDIDDEIKDKYENHTHDFKLDGEHRADLFEDRSNANIGNMEEIIEKKGVINPIKNIEVNKEDDSIEDDRENIDEEIEREIKFRDNPGNTNNIILQDKVENDVRPSIENDSQEGGINEIKEIIYNEVEMRNLSYFQNNKHIEEKEMEGSIIKNDSIIVNVPSDEIYNNPVSDQDLVKEILNNRFEVIDRNIAENENLDLEIEIRKNEEKLPRINNHNIDLIHLEVQNQDIAIHNRDENLDQYDHTNKEPDFFQPDKKISLYETSFSSEAEYREEFAKENNSLISNKNAIMENENERSNEFDECSQLFEKIQIDNNYQKILEADVNQANFSLLQIEVPKIIEETSPVEEKMMNYSIEVNSGSYNHHDSIQSEEKNHIFESSEKNISQNKIESGNCTNPQKDDDSVIDEFDRKMENKNESNQLVDNVGMDVEIASEKIAINEVQYHKALEDQIAENGKLLAIEGDCEKIKELNTQYREENILNQERKLLRPSLFFENQGEDVNVSRNFKSLQGSNSPESDEKFQDLL